jgi:winged helix DNA-binding protein
MLRAELDAVICSGGRRGKQFTYALLDERAPHSRNLKHEEALAELTERYFTSHGPATVRDFCWWSGLSTADAKAGLEMVKSKLSREIIGGHDYWLKASAPAARNTRRTVYLLPNYDEYIVGYTERSAIFDASHAKNLDARHNPLFNYTIVSDGQVIGTWKRTLRKASVSIVPSTFNEPSRSEAIGIGQAAKRFGEFMGLPVEVEGSLDIKAGESRQAEME